MKKLLSVVMLVCIVASMCTVSAWADGETATVVGGASFASLADALNAAPTGSTIELTAGEYTIVSTSNKALTIKAAANTDRASVVINIIGTYASAPAFHGCSLSFYGVTLKSENKNYNGMQHLTSLTVENCVIENEFWSYATTANFSGCTFNQPSSDKYNIWTYGSQNISFSNCYFNCSGKSVLVYNEGNIPGTNLNVSGCIFDSTSPVDGKAAIEIDTSINMYAKIKIDAATKASGFDVNSKCGNQLWNEKKTGTGSNFATITVGDTTVRTQGENTTAIDPSTGAPVNNNPAPNNPAPNNPAPAAPVVENVYYIPATDDNSNMALWSILALALLSTAFVTRKRKSEN